MVAVIAPPKPRFRGRIHQVAFFVSVPAGVVLIFLANGPAAIAVASVYAVSLAAVFGSSAVYHRGQWTERARRWMKRIDHSMIYVLIAASYTPVAALVLGGPWEVVLLSVIWTGAVVGVTMKMARPDGLSIVSAARANSSRRSLVVSRCMCPSMNPGSRIRPETSIRSVPS